MNLIVFLSFNEFMQQYGMIIALSLAGVVFAVVVVFFVIALVKRKKNGPSISTAPISKNEILEALGGKENIVSKALVGSRISLILKDYSKVNEDALNILGVDSVIKMSNKITLVVKGDSARFYKSLD